LNLLRIILIFAGEVGRVRLILIEFGNDYWCK
jgi:hypothetical protein